MIVSIRDTLFIEKVRTHKNSLDSLFQSNNITFPSGVHNQLYEQIDELTSLVDDFNAGIGISEQSGHNFKVEMARLSGGPLLTKFINQLVEKRDCLSGENGKF